MNVTFPNVLIGICQTKCEEKYALYKLAVWLLFW